eukprot:207669-Rhodomonas_salina.4
MQWAGGQQGCRLLMECEGEDFVTCLLVMPFLVQAAERAAIYSTIFVPREESAGKCHTKDIPY